MLPHCPRRAPNGLTALEVLIAIVIIIILATLSVPSIVNGVYKGKAATLLTDLETFKKAAFNYYTDYSAWPTSFNWNIPGDFQHYFPASFNLHIPKWDVTYRFLNYAWFEENHPRFWKSWQSKYDGYTVGIAVTSHNGRLINTLYNLAPRYFKQKRIEKNGGRMIYMLQ